MTNRRLAPARSPLPPILGLAAFLVAGSIVSCSRPPQPKEPSAPAQAAGPSRPEAEASGPARACTMMGCRDGLSVEVEGVASGPYRVEVRAEGEEPQAQECPAGRECGPLFFPGFVPEGEITVEVSADGESSTRTVRPEVETLQPNGPGCPPTCLQARVSVPRP